MTTDTIDILSNIRASAAGKNAAELAQLRKDIARHIRDLEPHLHGTEITQRFGSGLGPDNPQSASQQAARLERHRAELQFLDELLGTLDPILAAQAAAQ